MMNMELYNMPIIYCHRSSHNLLLRLHPIAYEFLKDALISYRRAPGEGLEPSSPEGHQLARHILLQYAHIHMISRLTPFRVHSDLPSLGTPALLI